MGALGWYWRRLGSGEVPDMRRRIRRVSMIVMAVAVFVFLGALSFVDEERTPSRYAVTWAMAITLLLLIVFAAFVDVLNSFRLHRAEARRIAEEARTNLLRTVGEARQRTAGVRDRGNQPDRAKTVK